MSVELDRQPTRKYDSQATKVEEEDDSDEKTSETHSNAPRFSFSHASHSDNPYSSNRRETRIPKYTTASPVQAAQPELKEVYGEIPWHCGEPQRYGTPKKGDSWQKCRKLAEKYDTEMCDAWKEEVDKLLIFAGLFSATVTAFVAESYKWLSEDPGDSSLQLIAFIANSSSSLPDIPQYLLPQPFKVSPADVRINTVWFLSLTLALTAVLIGTLCLQWLREYQRDPALPHKDAVALRQMRYEGLLYWRVPEILSLLPILLQLSLILFFFGLLDLLWTRHNFVAACVTVSVGIVMLFLAITTTLPALQHAFTTDKFLRVHQCPYKSPQSWLFYRAGHIIFYIINLFELPWSKFDSTRFHRLLKSAGDLNWMTFDMRWRQFRDATEVIRGTPRMFKDSDDVIHGLQWINATFTQSVDAVYPVYHSLADLDISTACQTISGFYINGQIDNSTFRVMLDDRFSPTDCQKRDIISAYYLHLHQETHPVLKFSYMESVIRIINSQDVPQPFYDWLSEILQDLVSTTPSSSTSTLSLAALDPEIIVQILICIKKLLPLKYGLQAHDIVVAWGLLHHLLSPVLIASQDDRGGIGINVHLDHLRLACGMFEEFEEWITQGREIDRAERVSFCAEGMLTLFPPSVNLSWLEDICPEMYKAASLVRALEAQLVVLGGAEALILRDRWWSEYWKIYSPKEWENLRKAFERIAITITEDNDDEH
ncbi:hypothetical protein CPC08DRAFT_461028 [Agrocybe pediades]|nr:hypothetical protein CPC08DRAFT_461028 [Agrocybe pediades]